MYDQGQEPPSPLSLLRVEMEVLWDLDERGRLTGPAPLLAVAESDAGETGESGAGEGGFGKSGGAEGAGECAVLVGAGVPDDLAESLERLAAMPSPPGLPPVAISRGAALLAGVCGPTVASAAPSYLVRADTAYPSGIRIGGTRIVTHAGLANGGDRSLDSGTAGLLGGGNPGDWSPSEWRDLLAGRLGPWAVAYEKGQIVAVCHTPVASAHGAEAGVWTRPGFRGRGLAAAVTARWAGTFPPGRHLFYSTTSDNRSSQRVAARLGLLPLGRVWRLSRPGEEGTHAERPWPYDLAGSA
ncbi:GNAT family N-acetyltransferase [Streptomyces axinellae]